MIENFKNWFFFLESTKNKVFFILCLFLVLLGNLLETIGIAITIPLLGLLVEKEFSRNYLFLIPNLSLFLENFSKSDLILLFLLIINFFFIIKFFFLYFTYKTQGKFYQKLVINLYQKLMQAYLKMPYLNYVNSNSSFFLKNLNVEISLIVLISKYYFILFTELVLVIFLFTLLLIYDFKTTLLSFSFFSFFILIFIKTTKKKLHYWGKNKMFEEEKLLKETIEIFRGIKEIRIFAAASYFSKKIFKRKFIISQIEKNQFILQQLPRLFVEIFTLFCLTIVIIFLLSSNKSFQDIIIIIGLYTFIILRIMPSVPKLTNVLSDLSFYSQNVTNLITEFKSMDKINLHDNLQEKIPFYNLIEMKNISFSYEDKMNLNKKIILKNISIKIPKGKKIGIFGDSGSGKTTFVNILLNLIKPSSGEIIIDGKKIDYSKNDIPLRIGFVPQDIFLLDDTLLNNVTFGEDEQTIDFNKFNKSIMNSQLEHFINISKIGIKNQIIGESGVKISGGQKQRIGIARALYKESDIIIFDEATNSLDNYTESKVFSEIKNLVPKKTIVVITHKYSLIENFDIIYKFDNSDVTVIKSY